MLVYGSLIFLAAAFFAVPELIKKRTRRFAFLAMIAVAALTSGRSALILAIPLGFAIGLFLRAGAPREAGGDARSRTSFLRYVLLVSVAAFVVFIADYLVDSIDLSVIVRQFWNKLIGGGGVERVSQASALWQGVQETWGLGAGHGMHVSVVRNYDYPWRYENVPMATLYRVGVLGSVVYALPFAIYIGKIALRIAEGTLGRTDRALFAGFASMSIAAATNPYIESFIFQWTFILPLVALEYGKSSAAAVPQQAIASRAAVFQSARG
jgi:hypothetical protein